MNNSEDVLSCLEKALFRICGGGIAQGFRTINPSKSSSQQAQTDNCRNKFLEKSESTRHHYDISIIDEKGGSMVERELRETWHRELRQLAIQSVSYPHGSKRPKTDTSTSPFTYFSHTCQQTVQGTAHDIEIRLALSFFHRYNQNGLKSDRKKKKKKRLGKKNQSDHTKKQKHDDILQVETAISNSGNIISKVEEVVCDHSDEKNIQMTPPPLEIISDLGLVRPIYSAHNLALLLIHEIEEILWHSRNSDIDCTAQDTDNVKNNASSDPPSIIRSNKSGMICIVTPKRIKFLRESGRLPCSQCIKWCKGEKGLWWHEQMEHKMDHSNATIMASSCFGGEQTLAIVPYQQNSQISNNSSYCKTDSHSSMEATKVCKDTEVSPTQLPLEPQPVHRLDNAYFDIIKEGSIKEFKDLLLRDRKEGGYNPKTHTDRNGASALHWAAGCGHLNIVKYLIEDCDCPPNQSQLGKRSFCGRTPLHWSARNGHLDVVQYLVEDCNTDVDASTVDGTTAFCWASWQGHLDIMKYLYHNKANPHTVNSFGCNAVLWSAQSTEAGLEAIIWLESIGSDICRINFNGHSVLHKAAQRGKEDVCHWMFGKMSLLSRMDVANALSFVAPDAENCCPSDVAGMEGHTKLAEWLVKQESKIAIPAYEQYLNDTKSSKSLPSWLKDGIEDTKHLANRACLEGLYEVGAGIKKMSKTVHQIMHLVASDESAIS